MFKGSFTALVTPFKSGELDIDALKHLVDWQIAEGTNGLVPMGTTGETPTVSHEEHEQVVEIVVKTAAGRVPVIAGAGSNNTIESDRYMAFAAKIGA
ncbi:MAG TPA: 4-hydroxy-tetrahydrodipicolinate synthase, partial [Rhodobacteraceae bacterium]|nr:4-hydroxy-tetrahydrodipicolinate synthase [Paracoccaceae bacterium]